MRRHHLLRTYDGWIARAEAEGTAEGRARAARRRHELAAIEAGLARRAGVVWIGAPADTLEPISRTAAAAYDRHGRR